MLILDWTPETWAAVGSGATALAFGVNAWVLALQLKDRRRSDAENVTVWVDDKYVPDSTGGAFVRSTDVHITNVGSRPVFDVQVVVGYGFLADDTTPVGPLAVPTLPVLGPGVHEDWPIGGVLEAAEIPPGRFIRAEASYRDSANRWWQRNFEGRVRRWYRPPPHRRPVKIADSEVNLDRFGPMTIDNPVAVAMAFHAALDEADTADGLAFLQDLCVPESIEDWGDFSTTRDKLEGSGIASFASYPALGVAYVKLPDEVDTAFRADGPTLLVARIMTLQKRSDLDPPGWRVFSVGLPIPPEDLPPVPEPEDS